MRRLFHVLFIVLTTGAWSQSPLPADSSRAFNGEWWTHADKEERSGFLNGIADCMTWEAGRQGFNATPEQLIDAISKFYSSHPGSDNLPVIDAWQKVVPEYRMISDDKHQAEVWKNPHWYLNGDWWNQISDGQKRGFLEGYLWCLKTQFSTPPERYSMSVASYLKKIDAFVRKNPNLGNEAIAITLQRFRDSESVITPK